MPSLCRESGFASVGLLGAPALTARSFPGSGAGAAFGGLVGPAGRVDRVSSGPPTAPCSRIQRAERPSHGLRIRDNYREPVMSPTYMGRERLRIRE